MVEQTSSDHATLRRIRAAITETKVKNLHPKFVVLSDNEYTELLNDLDNRYLTALLDTPDIRTIYGLKIILTSELVVI